MRSKTMIRIILTGLLIFVMGCSKKVTKTAPETQEVSQPETPPIFEDKKLVTPYDLEAKEESKVTPEIALANIYFDFDRYDLRPEAREILANHARILKENPQITVRIEGHCDEWGTIEYNLALGERRAAAVRNYLINYGIEPRRLATISYGKERPLDPRRTPEAWAKNRRATFVIH